MTDTALPPAGPSAAAERIRYRMHVGGWLNTTDHKRIGLMTISAGLLVFLGMGALALVMRTQITQPDEQILSPHTYAQLFTIHGSGMIYLAVTPLAVGFGVYLVPLQIGAPMVAAPRVVLSGFWLYMAGALSVLAGFATTTGAGAAGWFAYTPLSDASYTPGYGMDLWIFGVFCATLGMILMSACLLWTVLTKRAPHMTMLRMPVFTWAIVVSLFMVVAAFPALLAAMTLQAVGRVHPDVFTRDFWNVAYDNLFWFYGHPVVYVMFFPFMGAVAEVLATFARRSFVGYKPTVLSLLTFSTLSMSVWGHHMLTTGQVNYDYFQLTSTLLVLPAGIEYFGMVGTLVGGRLSFPTPMLFALAFIPQFLIGGLTGIMLATPAFDWNAHNSYFLVAHFHYTLLGGSVFGLFAGIYFWFPKATGVLLREGLGKVHFVLMTLGTNLLILPMFPLGLLGLPRRVASYPNLPWFGTLSAISTVGGSLVGIGAAVFVANVVVSVMRPQFAGADPWQGHSLEWATSSPPPPFNFNREWPVPKITGFAPLLNLRLEAEGRAEEAVRT